jgi:hypothetical protein
MAKDRTAYQPDNLNHLSPVGFTMTLEKAPNLEFKVQDCTLPSLSLPAIPIATRHTAMNVPGETMTFTELDVTFIVDEDMRNYEEIQKWMYALSAAKNFQSFKDLKDENPEGEKQDVKLNILTNKDNQNIVITFLDAFPTSLSQINFSAAAGEIESIICSVTFAYTTFDLFRGWDCD